MQIARINIDDLCRPNLIGRRGRRASGASVASRAARAASFQLARSVKNLADAPQHRPPRWRLVIGPATTRPELRSRGNAACPAKIGQLVGQGPHHLIAGHNQRRRRWCARSRARLAAMAAGTPPPRHGRPVGLYARRSLILAPLLRRPHGKRFSGRRRRPTRMAVFHFTSILFRFSRLASRAERARPGAAALPSRAHTLAPLGRAPLIRSRGSL
jgi:hypothetical protein